MTNLQGCDYHQRSIYCVLSLISLAVFFKCYNVRSTFRVINESLRVINSFYLLKSRCYSSPWVAICKNHQYNSSRLHIEMLSIVVQLASSHCLSALHFIHSPGLGFV